MKLKALNQKFSQMRLFNKSVLRRFEKNENNLNLNIKYWLKSGKIINLKQGWYVLAEKYAQESDKDSYLEFIANKLIEPSYLSAEYVLNKYGVLTEAVSALTSMTTAPKREIRNPLAAFRYYSLSRRLFAGYQAQKRGKNIILEADLAKALFDFLYIRFFRGRPTNEKGLENLRLNWENIPKKTLQESAGFLKKARSQKMVQLYQIIKNKYYAD